MDHVPPPEAFEPQPVEPQQPGLRRWLMVAVTLVVVVALVVLAFVGSGGIIVGVPAGTSDRAQPRLAVVDGQGRLRLVGLAGGAAIPLGSSEVRFSFPAWSPDGAHVAAIGQAADEVGVYVFSADSGTESDSSSAAATSADAGEPVVVYASPDRPPFYLYWTPDGRSVSFLTTEADNLALRVAPIDGTGDRLVRGGAPMYWDFVDATHLLVNAGAGGPDAFLGEVGVDGSAGPATTPSTGVFRAPDVSADGRYRAFLAAGDDPVGEIVREARDGSGATRVRVFGAAAMSFGPTGDALAFLAPDQLTSSGTPLPLGPLRILDPTVFEPRTILGGTVIAFFWSPTGRTIAALRVGGQDDQVTRAVADGGEVPVARSVSGAAPPGVTAAAGVAVRLTFVGVDDGSVTPDRVVHLSDLFVNQVLPYFDQYALSHRFWSPDGRFFVLPIADEDAPTRLFAIPVDGSEPTAIADGEFASWSP